MHGGDEREERKEGRGRAYYKESGMDAQGGVGIIIPDRGPVGWFGRQAAKKILEPQDIWLKNGIDGCHEAL